MSALGCSTSDYWPAARLGADALHRAGLRGAGVTIGLIDTGTDTAAAGVVNKVLEEAYFDASGQQVTHFETDSPRAHGTRTAALIAGNTVGLAADAMLRLAVVPTRRSHWAVRAALDWFSLDPPDVLVMPLALRDPEAPLALAPRLNALAYQNKVLIIPSGNRGPGNAALLSGAPGTLTVGACDRAGNLSKFSGTRVLSNGRVLPDLLAPGEGLPPPQTPAPDAPWLRSGTSFAAALTAGLAALLTGTELHGPGWSLADCLLHLAVEPTADDAFRTGAGCIDARAALNLFGAQGRTKRTQVADATPVTFPRD